MPRKRPGALRADRSDHRRPIRRGPSAELDEVTVRRLYWRVRVEGPLERYRRFLRQPGRRLYLPRADLYSPHDPAEARDELERLKSELPPRARGELRRMLAPLDEELRRRTIRDPYAASVGRLYGTPWWWHRLREDL
ncbi:hypothetical protein [Saccharopolyspora antimicrobica]|uniref:Uncharacterized protein n=1 Tax=Saccharopolyspora antimicrobica TaxID=455193 RepID=A0ABX9TC48_9PSEU|nr:hypothetical protein [Saccharopolyspora antimicrobica]RKT84605.1 hypothetical protein ATL45_2928 [Saccharopolyspora antimicrobica]